MVTIFLRGRGLISALVREAQLEQSRDQCAFGEPYNGNCQELGFIPHFSEKFERNVPCDGYWLLEIEHSALH